MKKLKILGIVGIITFLLINSYILFGLNENDDEYYEYNYYLSITTNADQSYILWISIPEGWINFTDYLKGKSGEIDYLLMDINGQPSLNVTGKGNASLRFQMESKDRMVFSFIKNWDRNGTKVYLDRSGSPPVSILMENTFKHWKDWKTIHDSRFQIKVTLSSDGWQYVHMTVAQS